MSDHVRSLDRITVPEPCNADWESMIGNDQVRFCEHCNLHVTNLSSMTRQEAIHFVARSKGRLCVRYLQRPNGGKLTKQMTQQLQRIGWRISRVAAGAFTATLSLSTVAAQSTSSPSGDQNSPIQMLTQRRHTTNDDGARLSGTLTDPNSAVLPGATVTLKLRHFR